MAVIENPRKQFNFSILCAGLNPFLAQNVNTPDYSLEVATHGDANYKVKTAGLPDIGTLMIEKISPATAPDNWVWIWIRDIQNTFTGGGQLPSNYKRTIEIQQYSNDGVTILNRWMLYGCWPSKINGVEFKRLGSENTLENLELQVDRILHL